MEKPTSSLTVYYLSDLHLEFKYYAQPPRFPSNSGELRVLVLAGDVGDPLCDPYREYVRSAVHEFGAGNVIVVLGNHEYYRDDHKPMSEVQAAAQLVCDEEGAVLLGAGRISYVHAASHVRFVGCTLWSPVYHDNVLSDFDCIPEMNPDTMNRLHAGDKQLLRSHLCSEHKHDGHTVVVTHHMPSLKLVAPEYADESHEGYASSTAEDLGVTESTVSAWIYGHTHSRMHMNLNGVPYYCNALGYKRELPSMESIACFKLLLN